MAEPLDECPELATIVRNGPYGDLLKGLLIWCPVWVCPSRAPSIGEIATLEGGIFTVVRSRPRVGFG